MKKTCSTLIIMVAIAFAFPPNLVRAQTPLFFDDIGASPRAIALGQAFTAVADDPSAAYYNPAGLTQIPTHFMVGVGYLYSKPKIYINVYDKEGDPYEPHFLLEQRDPSRSEDRGTGGVWLGIGTNFSHLSVFNDPPHFLRNLALGFVMFYSLPDINTFWNPQRKQDPYHLRYNYGYCLMNIAMSAGYRITDYLSVGLGIMPRVDTFQDTQGNYIDLLTALVDPSDPNRGFRLRLKTRLKVYAEGIVGILFRPPFLGLDEILSLGVAYRREISGYYGTGLNSDDVVIIVPEGQTVVIGGVPYGPGSKIILFPIDARSVDFIGYNPAQISAGLALKPFQGMTVSADVTWKDYSEFNFFWALPPEPRFKDTWIPRVGLEYFFQPSLNSRFLREIDKIRIMGGYYYEPSPVPDMNGEMNILDSDMNVVSAGAGLDYRLKGVSLLKIQAYFQAHLAKERVLNNEGDPLFGRITSGGEVYSLGINVSILL